MDGSGGLVLLRRFRPLACGRLREIEYHRELSWADYSRIRTGYVPRSSRDKWLVLHQRGELLFYRSGNGTFVYGTKFSHAGGVFHASRLVVNDDPGQLVPQPDHYERTLLNYLIERLLLGREVRFPAPPGIDSRQAELLEKIWMG